jgi:hypothetical protein
MTLTQAFKLADELVAGDLVCEADGFLARVTSATIIRGRVRLTLVPEYGSPTWPAGEERAVTLRSGSGVRVG